MLSHSRRLLALAVETRVAVADAGVVSGEVAGSLAVSAPETLLTYRLPSLLALFHERHPRVRLSVRPSAVGRLVGGARRAVEEGAVDVAFVLDESSGDRPPPGLEIEDLVEEGIVVISPAAHALVAARRVVPADLAGETLLLPEAPESGCAYRGQFERHLGAAGVVPPEKMEFQSIEAVKRCVAAGMGVSVLPSVAVEGELRSGELCALAWDGSFDVRTRMAWHGERWRSPALRAFLETAREAFGSAAAPVSSAATGRA